MKESEVILDLTESTFTAAVQDPTPILIDFWAPWCGPCVMMKPILSEVVQLLRGIARVAKINVDDEPGLAAAFGIRGIPTLVLIQDGKVIDAVSGVTPAVALADRVKARVQVQEKVS